MDFRSNYRMLIDGRLVDGARHIEVINPATEKVIGTAPDCTKEQLDMAVEAARRAFASWKNTSIDTRRNYLYAIADALEPYADELGRLMTSENGKPHPMAIGEVQYSADWLRQIAKQELPDRVTEDNENAYTIIRHVPVGVVAGILAWNGPVGLAIWKMAPALLTGNTVILKPSEFTPLSTLKIGEIIKDIVPPGVVNIVSGDRQVGEWITKHPGINKIGFTGSSATGKKIMESSAGNLKRIALELGGNDAAIVFPDVDIPSIVPELFQAAFVNSGQVCSCTKRMYIHEDIYEPLSAALVEHAKTVKIGDGAEQGTDLGPLTNKAQYEKVCNLLTASKEAGLNFLCGGEIPEGPGYFLPVSIIDNPPENSRIVREEQFGPILPLLKFKDIDDVVRRANDTNYGLGGSIWTNDIETAQEVASQIESGNVWINQILNITSGTPFGGHKDSGFGVEHGHEGLAAYTNLQAISVKKKPNVSAA